MRPRTSPLRWRPSRHAAARLYLVVPPAAAALALTTGTGGAFTYPDMTPGGGTVAGIVVLTSDAMTTDALLVDSSRLLLADGGIVLDASTAAALQLNSTPTDPVDAAAVIPPSGNTT